MRVDTARQLREGQGRRVIGPVLPVPPVPGGARSLGGGRETWMAVAAVAAFTGSAA